MAYSNKPSGEMVTHRDYGKGAASDGRDVLGGVVSEVEDLSTPDWESEGNPMVTQSPVATANATQPTKALKNHVA